MIVATPAMNTRNVKINDPHSPIRHFLHTAIEAELAILTTIKTRRSTFRTLASSGLDVRLFDHFPEVARVLLAKGRSEQIPLCSSGGNWEQHVNVEDRKRLLPFLSDQKEGRKETEGGSSLHTYSSYSCASPQVALCLL